METENSPRAVFLCFMGVSMQGCGRLVRGEAPMFGQGSHVRAVAGSFDVGALADLFGQGLNVCAVIHVFSFRKRIFSSTKTGEPTVLWFWIPVSLVPVSGTDTLRPVVDHQFANWWIAPELREGHELDRKIDGHCESTRVDACASLHGGWFIARGCEREPSWRVIHNFADACAAELFSPKRGGTRGRCRADSAPLPVRYLLYIY